MGGGGSSVDYLDSNWKNLSLEGNLWKLREAMGGEGSSVDNPDSNWKNLSLDGNSGRIQRFIGINDYSQRYNMNHKNRGLFIIINNKMFYNLKNRNGTDVDASNLHHLFKKLGFSVQRYDNLTVYEMSNIMIRVGKQDHSDCDCFGVAVLSHGNEGILFGTDSEIAIDKFVEPIRECRSLFGKPKLFFVQACRGTGIDYGGEVETDAQAEEPRCPIIRIPQEADFLFAYSTTPGYLSYRHTSKGSWFIQALFRVFTSPDTRDIDLLRILTRVNHMVAHEFDLNAAHVKSYHKQIPSIVSQLTKELYF